MILDVMQAAAAEPVPWWMSATAPWWATPVSTLAGALLAWTLARLTAHRATRDADARETKQLKRQAYAEFWSATLAHHRAASFKDDQGRHDGLLRATEAILIIDLVAPDSVREASRTVIDSMTSKTTGKERGTAMQQFRLAVQADLDLPKR